MSELSVTVSPVDTDVGGGPVADVGCGPGHVTAHLRDSGLDAFGIDLSPVMIDVARREHPGLRFEVGSMTDRFRGSRTATRDSRSRPTCWLTRTPASLERSFSHAARPSSARTWP